MKSIKYWILLMGCLALACKNPTTSQSREDTTATTTESEAPTEKPKEIEMVGNIPVYNTYMELEPLFQQQNDTTYVLNFWATWCKPCVEELPYFEKLHQSLAGEKFKIVLISMDFPSKFESHLLPFVEKHELQSDVVAFTDPDQNSWIPKIEEKWEGAIPVTVVYNADERKFVGEQFDNYEQLETLVKSML